MPKVTINDQEYEVESGKTIIQVADEVRVQIPRYCYHPDIGIEGSRRMCLIEAEGAPKLMPSCATPIRDGMVVRTNTERVAEAVRYAMEFLLLHHPIDCPVCDQSGECWLQDYYMEHAGHESRVAVEQKTRRRKAFDIGPQVKLDQERCILCTRCVRFTENVTGTAEIQILGRGHSSKIGIYKDRPLDNPYSINVVDICPVGALTSSDFRFKVRSWFLKGTPSVCGGCSTGCNLRIDHSARAQGGGIPGLSATDGVVYRTIGRRNPDVNKSWLCDEGRLSFHALETGARIAEGRVGNETRRVDDCLGEAHRNFEELRAEYGGDAVAGLGSATNTNEALFLLKTYFEGRADFRLGHESELYTERQDDLLRRMDKHPNTRGALDLGLASDLGGLRGLCEAAENGSVKGVWIAFHPQLVDEDSDSIVANLDRLIAAVNFSVVSTTHAFDWTKAAAVLVPMAAWSEESGTYTNYEGRIQLVKRAVTPVSEVRPLHRLMAGMLRLAGKTVDDNPAKIFEDITRRVPRYSGMDYEAVGPMGAPAGAEAEPQAVVQ